MLSGAEKDRPFNKQLLAEMEAINGSNSTGRVMGPKSLKPVNMSLGKKEFADMIVLRLFKWEN